MATQKMFVSGSLSLEELDNSLNSKESVDRIKLVGLSISDEQPESENEPQNVATFIDVSLGVSVPELKLEIVTEENPIEVLTKKHTDQGRKLVFHSPVLVEDEEVDLGGFR